MSVHSQNIKLTVIHKNGTGSVNNGGGLLRFAVGSGPLADIIFDGLKDTPRRRCSSSFIAVPQDWTVPAKESRSDIIYCKENIPIPLEISGRLKANQWCIVSDGRFATRVDCHWLCKISNQLQTDIVAVNVSSQLQAAHEKILTVSHDRLIGFRRFYNNVIQPALIPDDWPHHLFIKAGIFDKLLVNGALPLAFSEFAEICSSSSLVLRSISAGGDVLDLNTEEGLFEFVAESNSFSAATVRQHGEQNGEFTNGGAVMAAGARLFGKVILGRNVSIGQNAVVIGPTVVSDNAEIGAGAIINSSIIGPNVSVPQNQLVQNRIISQSEYNRKHPAQTGSGICSRVIVSSRRKDVGGVFRTWPRFSYAGCFKRITDIIIAAIVLVLFVPVLPIVALVIKLTSRGPVFFKDARQGLYGRTFNCLKFRTMLAGADKMQERLRVLNQVDGPQFRMADDPRLSAVGKFLRDTYIDEVPQFFNVLLGQMSVVGPRPSPESENTLCPSWRDARLSVRPGITGLWQVCRTRQPMRDFQEWIYYDVKYIRDLSLKMDLWICWRTVKKMVGNFVSQF